MLLEPGVLANPIGLNQIIIKGKIIYITNLQPNGRHSAIVILESENSQHFLILFKDRFRDLLDRVFHPPQKVEVQGHLVNWDTSIVCDAIYLIDQQ